MGIEPVSAIHWAAISPGLGGHPIGGRVDLTQLGSHLRVQAPSDGTNVDGQHGMTLDQMQNGLASGLKNSFVNGPLEASLRAYRAGDLQAGAEAEVRLMVGSMHSSLLSKIAKTTTEGIKSLTQQS
jgi:hypothetical protein